MSNRWLMILIGGIVLIVIVSKCDLIHEKLRQISGKPEPSEVDVRTDRVNISLAFKVWPAYTNLNKRYADLWQNYKEAMNLSGKDRCARLLELMPVRNQLYQDIVFLMNKAHQGVDYGPELADELYDLKLKVLKMKNDYPIIYQAFCLPGSGQESVVDDQGRVTPTATPTAKPSPCPTRTPNISQAETLPMPKKKIPLRDRARKSGLRAPSQRQIPDRITKVEAGKLWLPAKLVQNWQEAYFCYPYNNWCGFQDFTPVSDKFEPTGNPAWPFAIQLSTARDACGYGFNFRNEKGTYALVQVYGVGLQTPEELMPDDVEKNSDNQLWFILTETDCQQ